MSTLYINRKNTRMTVSGNTLVFYENGERASTLPLHLIDRICIKGDLTLSAADLGKLGAHDIGVLILSGRSQQPAIYSHPPKASYCVAPLRRTTAYCLQRRALSETFGGWLYLPCARKDALRRLAQAHLSQETPSASSRHKPGSPKKSSANKGSCANYKPARITADTKSTNPSHNSNSAVASSKKP